MEQITWMFMPQGHGGVEREVADCEGPCSLGEELDCIGLYSECDVKIVEGFEEECNVV